jgi:hypothetical protein
MTKPARPAADPALPSPHGRQRRLITSCMKAVRCPGPMVMRTSEFAWRNRDRQLNLALGVRRPPPTEGAIAPRQLTCLWTQWREMRSTCLSAPRAGLEPAAYCLGGSRSIRLSYRGRNCPACSPNVRLPAGARPSLTGTRPPTATTQVSAIGEPAGGPGDRTLRCRGRPIGSQGQDRKVET